MGFILAIDQGTSATTAAIINEKGSVLAARSVEFPQHYPQPGFVEHYAHEIKHSVEQAVVETLKEACLNAAQISAIGITNQRETVCFFDRQGQTPLPFIVWQCRRTSDYCDELIAKGLDGFIHKTTGLKIDPYFSATKLTWIFKHHPEIRQAAEKGEMLFGTIDTFLTHWLSGGALHITDVTNASRTMLMDIATCKWRDECLDLFQVPKKCLPQIVKNVGPFGHTKGLGFLPDGIPIAALVGDQQGSLFGQACFNRGDAKITFGTGCFVLLNLGQELILSRHGLLTSIAYQLDDRPVYCLEGSAFVAGAAVAFLRDNLGIIKETDEIESLARQIPDSEGVVFVPALCGLGAPHWRPHARGVFAGLTRGTTKAHFARATLEGIALQNTDILGAMAKDAFEVKSLKVDGGASKNDLLMQIQCDLLNLSCSREQSPHKTAVGAAFLAGIAMGIFKDTRSLAEMNKVEKRFDPKMPSAERARLIKQYQDVLQII